VWEPLGVDFELGTGFSPVELALMLLAGGFKCPVLAMSLFSPFFIFVYLEVLSMSFGHSKRNKEK
jgi:hypothetical protein